MGTQKNQFEIPNSPGTFEFESKPIMLENIKKFKHTK